MIYVQAETLDGDVGQLVSAIRQMLFAFISWPYLQVKYLVGVEQSLDFQMNLLGAMTKVPITFYPVRHKSGQNPPHLSQNMQMAVETSYSEGNFAYGCSLLISWTTRATSDHSIKSLQVDTILQLG